MTLGALFVSAVLASIFGSVVGLGGGFVMVPVLRVGFHIEPTLASATSLILVMANTAAASVGFLRDRRVDLKLATWLAIGAIPGSVIGVFFVHHVSGLVFDAIYGALLVFLGFATIRRRGVPSRPAGETTFLHQPGWGLISGVIMGIASGMFGIGGGVVVVPLMLIAARMPPHIAAATSSFVILLSAPVGIAAHVASHDVDWALAVPLVVGGLLGGTFGPQIARRISSPQLINLLIAAFFLAAIGLIMRHL